MIDSNLLMQNQMQVMSVRSSCRIRHHCKIIVFIGTNSHDYNGDIILYIWFMFIKEKQQLLRKWVVSLESGCLPPVRVKSRVLVQKGNASFLNHVSLNQEKKSSFKPSNVYSGELVQDIVCQRECLKLYTLKPFETTLHFWLTEKGFLCESKVQTQIREIKPQLFKAEKEQNKKNRELKPLSICAQV